MGTKRFTELEKLLPGISRKILIEQLKELELYQIIERKVYPQIPPKVEYSLTLQGKELFPVFESLYK
jgi:DNA-binding HxlR family transcriptional regulator